MLIPTRVWKLLLAVGAVVWIIAAAVTEITDDNILVPTVIIVGSFMVPVTVAAFALSREREGYLTTEEVLLGFLAAGTLGVVTTALLEVYLLPAAAGTFIAVGFIEEVGKGAVLLAVAHRVHHREPRDGMVLGAVVGAGFAAFESAGYALQAMLDNIDERPVVNILEIEAFRAVLAPFGHITWTALLGGALFASSRGGRFRVTDAPRRHVRRHRHPARDLGPGVRLGRRAQQGRERRRMGARMAERGALARGAERSGAALVQRLLRRDPGDPRPHRVDLGRCANGASTGAGARPARGA